jgi:hypothetical protein
MFTTIMASSSQNTATVSASNSQATTTNSSSSASEISWFSYPTATYPSFASFSSCYSKDANCFELQNPFSMPVSSVAFNVSSSNEEQQSTAPSFDGSAFFSKSRLKVDFNNIKFNDVKLYADKSDSTLEQVSHKRKLLEEGKPASTTDISNPFFLPPPRQASLRLKKLRIERHLTIQVCPSTSANFFTAASQNQPIANSEIINLNIDTAPLLTQIHTSSTQSAAALLLLDPLNAKPFKA